MNIKIITPKITLEVTEIPFEYSSVEELEKIVRNIVEESLKIHNEI